MFLGYGCKETFMLADLNEKLTLKPLPGIDMTIVNHRNSYGELAIRMEAHQQHLNPSKSSNNMHLTGVKAKM